MNAVELYVKAGLYEKADFALRKALECSNDAEKKEIKRAFKTLLKQQAEVYLKENRKGYALKAYEKFYKVASEPEKTEVKDKLLILYQQLGKINEYNILKGVS